MAILNGVDVSSWQNNLNVQDLKKANYEFVIARGGYTGYGDGRSKNKDKKFDEFYIQAKNCNMPIGVYYYSCATNEQGGIEEAQFLYENCLKDKQFEMPIYIDVEDARWQSSDRIGVTKAIIGFCKHLESLKFYSGVYASISWFENCIETYMLEPFTKWVAAWRDIKPPFKWGGFHMWQKANNGQINGSQIDLDEAFVVFPNIIKSAGLNGYAKDKINFVEYEVKKGDTLWGIAKKYFGEGIKYKEIQKINNLKNELIYPGQRLRINV